MADISAYKSIEGRDLGLGPKGNLTKADGTVITHPVTDAAITVGAENTNVRAIGVQLKDANGNNVEAITDLEVQVLLDATGTAFAATGGSTGIADGGDGTILAVVAKKLFKAKTDATGSLELTWTDTGTEAAYLGVVLPNGRVVISAALTNA